MIMQNLCFLIFLGMAAYYRSLAFVISCISLYSLALYYLKEVELDSSIQNAFSSTYAEARNKFLLTLGRTAGLFEHVSLPLKNGHCIDIAVRDLGASATLVHISGTHGVEGYAGSAIQIHALNQFIDNPDTLPSNVNIVFIHILNPWGMANDCRWNENNVDLNRNALSKDAFRKWEEFPSDLYALVSPMINPTTAKTTMCQKFCGIFTALYFILVHGYVTLKNAVVLGQVVDPEGIFYIGSEPEENHAVVKDFLKRRFPNPKHLFGVDVHTGLGKSGEDTLLHAEESDVPFITENFPNSGNPKPVMAGYEIDDDALRGSVKHAVPRWLEPENHIFFVQEFGTIDSLQVLWSLVAENSARHHGSETEYWRAREESRAAFYVERNWWKQKIIDRGNIVLMGMLNAAAKAEGGEEVNV